jgi:hypothetical protein
MGNLDPRLFSDEFEEPTEAELFEYLAHGRVAPEHLRDPAEAARYRAYLQNRRATYLRCN